MFGFDIKTYAVNIMGGGIIILLITMLIGVLNYENTINGLNNDISDLEIQEGKLDKKIDRLQSANKDLLHNQKNNQKVISELQKDLNSSKELTKEINKNHQNETSKLKKLISSLKKDADVTGDVHLKDCLIKMRKVDNEKDYIGATINNIGF